MRALIVPLIAVGMWLVPSDRPDTEVAGAVEVASLADAAPTTASQPSSTTTEAEPAVVETTTSLAASTTTSLAPTAPETTAAPSTAVPITVSPTTVSPTTVSPTTVPLTTVSPTTVSPTTVPLTTVAPTTVAPTTTVSSLSLGEQALERVSYDWRTAFPNWDVQFLGPRNGIRALTYPSEKRVEIFVRSSDTAATLHRVFAHELGHVIDVELNSAADRDRWLEQRGLSGSTRWWPNAESPDFATGAGDFAEAFAVWETGVTTRSTLAGQPTRADLDLLRELSQG